MFKEDDVVVCVDNTDYEGFLTEGCTYKVIRSDGANLIELFGDNGELVICYSYRFDLYTNPFTKMKFRVKDEEHSKLIQEHLFSLGYGWGANRDKEVKYTDKEFLYTYNDGSLYYGEDVYNYEEKESPEMELISTTTYSLKPVEKEELVELIELNGKKYNKRDLEEALSKLTPVDD